MKGSGQLATSFITLFGSYCCTTMPFGLKNAGATYQRCMLKFFGELIGDMVEDYVDDIILKSKNSDYLVSDLEKAFAKLRTNEIRLNLEKCIFGVLRGMLLGLSSTSVASRPTWKIYRSSRRWV